MKKTVFGKLFCSLTALLLILAMTVSMTACQNPAASGKEDQASAASTSAVPASGQEDIDLIAGISGYYTIYQAEWKGETYDRDALITEDFNDTNVYLMLKDNGKLEMRLGTEDVIKGLWDSTVFLVNNNKTKIPITIQGNRILFTIGEITYTFQKRK